MSETGADLREAIRAHIERHIGPIAHVFRERGEDTAGIDVHHVAPVDSRPYHTLVTAGMSELPMPVPANADAPHRLELMMTLPEQWRLDGPAADEKPRGEQSPRERPAPGEQWYWPIRLLHSLARLPRERHTWLGWGHTVPNGDPPQAFAPGTRLCGVIIAPSLLVPASFYELDSGGQRVAFYSAIPLYREELELKAREGMEALLTRLLRHDINDVVEPKRRNVAKRFFGLF